MRIDKPGGLRGRALGLAAAALFCVSASAQAAAWWRLPLWGAEVRVFAVDPFEASVVYCGTSRGNFYGSKDGGATWEPLASGPAFPGYYVTALLADPAVPGRLWAAVAGELQGGRVVVSDDRGATWKTLLQSKEAVTTRALAITPGEPRLLAAGGDDGVRVSKDGGKTWTRTGVGVPGLLQVESLAFDPADRGTLYAGTWRQAFRTRDGGASWNRIAEGMVLDATVYAWDFDAADARDIWVSTCGWVYRTRDGGDRWTRFTAGFTNRRSHAVRRDPGRPGVVYAATVGGLHRSSDSGATWIRVTRDTLVVTALEVDRRSGRLYVGTEGEGVFYSDDGGLTLEPGSRGLAESRVAELVADPNDPARIYFFRAFAGEESGVWEARGRDVRKVSVDVLPASASLTAFRGKDGGTRPDDRELGGRARLARRRRALEPGRGGFGPAGHAAEPLRRALRRAGARDHRRRLRDARRRALHGRRGRAPGGDGRSICSRTRTASPSWSCAPATRWPTGTGGPGRPRRRRSSGAGSSCRTRRRPSP